MSKKIQITVEIEIQDDDYETDYKPVITGGNKLEVCKDWLIDLVEFDSAFKVVKVEVV